MTLKTTLKLVLLSTCLLLIKVTAADVPVPKNEPETVEGFTCAGKVIGGYYADVYENCQVFHVCTIGENGETRDIVFRCLNGTVFDQETRVCEREEEVDCSRTESFFHLNNVLYGPGIIPDTAAILKQDRRQTQTQKFRDNETPPTRTTLTTIIDSESLCRGKTRASLTADHQTNCAKFHVCIPQLQHSELIRSFVCADEGFAFDQKTGKCRRREEVECSPHIHPFLLPIVDAETFAVYTLGLCSFLGRGALVSDTLSGCEQYIHCPMDHTHEAAVKRCQDGFLFSQMHQKCVTADKVLCQRDIFSLSKFVQLRTSGIMQDNAHWDVKHSKRVNSSIGSNHVSELPPFFRRRRRALTLGDEHSRQSPSGALNNPPGIVNDHVSVIEAQSPGNVVETKSAVPRITLQPEARSTQSSGKHAANQIDIIHKKNRANPPSVRPETSLGINKTTLNGTTIEVSEIATPDQKGIVTITSVVPKTVRQNGNGGSKTTRAPLNVIPSSGATFITNGKTKITLLGSEPSTPSDETLLKEEIGTKSGDGKSTADADQSTITIAPSADKETVIEEARDIIDEAFIDIQETTTVRMEQTTQEVSEESDDVTLQETLLTEEPTAEVMTTMPTSSSTHKTSTISTTPLPTSTTTSTTTTTTATSTTTTTTTTTESTTEPSPETNFTCKDKVLDNFYPDIEKNCRLFHYCSPGFTDDEVLDLTFVCSGDTRFDIHTKKCQDMSTVVCGEAETTPSTTTTKSSTSSVSSTISVSSSTTTTPSTTTTTKTTTTPSTTTAEAITTSASSTTTPEEIQETSSPIPEEGDDSIHSGSVPANLDVETTTLQPDSSSSASEVENWNSKVEEESATTSVVPEEEQDLSTQHHLPKMELIGELDNTETTTTVQSTDFSQEQTTLDTSENTIHTSGHTSPPDSSTIEPSNDDILSTPFEGGPISSDAEATMPSEAESTIEDSLTKDININSDNLGEDESVSSTAPSTNSLPDTVIPDDNLNLITDGRDTESSLSTSVPPKTSDSLSLTTEAPLEPGLQTDVSDSESDSTTESIPL